MPEERLGVASDTERDAGLSAADASLSARTTLTFARHGESEANLGQVFSNRDLPHRLTPKGVEHAIQLADLFRAHGIEELWSSPVPRAVETAAIVSQRLDLPYQVTDALREFDVGRFEGTDSQEGWDEYASVMRLWLAGDFEARVGGGESLAEIVLRLRRFLDRFTREPASRCVGLIGHGGLYRMALPHVLDNVSPRFAIEHTQAYGQTVIAQARGGVLTCLEWNGVTPA
jgi:broad specificity phosphatase PhoE